MNAGSFLGKGIWCAIAIALCVGWRSFGAGNPWWVAFAQGYLCVVVIASLLVIAYRALAGSPSGARDEAMGGLDVTIGTADGRPELSR